MRPVYPRFFTVTILLLLLTFSSHFSYAQCPSGQPGGQTAFDTTIAFGAGIVSTDVKFPKFDPMNGMVTCVKLCVTIKGIIDTVALENLSNLPQTGSYTYNRKDTIRGPGIPTFLTSPPTNLNFGPIPLGATNGVFGSGPDFFSNGPDTVLTKVLCSNISDSTTIAQFYGIDSVTYNYTIDADANGFVGGGSYLAFVLSSGLVNFHFEYCTCPSVILDFNVHEFNVTKLTADRAELRWTGYDDENANYHYEAEMSRNGHSFVSIAALPKNTANSDPYRFVYRAINGESGTYFFRIKQVYSNGYSRFSSIRQVILENPDFPKFTLYPNPSNGIVGIKFDNVSTGQFNIQIFNTQGQTMVKKDIVAGGSSYVQVATLQGGVYWLRLTDMKSQNSCVNQLLIK